MTTACFGFGRRGTQAIIAFATRLLTVSLLVACDDPVGPDDVRRLLGPPVLGEVDLEASADAVLDVPLQGLLRFPSSEIVVEHEGEWATYRALVIEIAFDPDTGHYDGVSRNRLRMPTQRVPGIRITVACDNSPSAEVLGCGEWKFAPDW